MSSIRVLVSNIRVLVERTPGAGLVIAAAAFFLLNGSDAVSGLVIDESSAWIVAALTAVFGALFLGLVTERARLFRPGGRRRVRELGMTSLINRMSVSDVFVLPLTLLALGRLESLGTVIALMWFGPLCVTIWKLITGATQRLSSLLWIPLASVGVVVLTRPWEGTFDILGILLALGGAVCYANFIVTYDRMSVVNAMLNEKYGVEDSRVPVAVAESHLRSAAAMTILGAITIPTLVGFGLTVPGITPGPDWLSWRVVVFTAVAGLLTGVFATGAHNMIFGWELLKPEMYAVLTAFEPLVAMLLGLWILGYQANWVDWVGAALVTAAGIGCYYQLEYRVARVAHTT